MYYVSRTYYYTIIDVEKTAVLVVFDDDIAAYHFLRMAGDEMKRARVRVPV